MIQQEMAPVMMDLFGLYHSSGPAQCFARRDEGFRSMDVAPQSDRRFGLVSVDSSQRDGRPRNGKRGTRSRGGAIANRVRLTHARLSAGSDSIWWRTLLSACDTSHSDSSTRVSLSHRPDKNHIRVGDALYTRDLHFGPKKSAVPAPGYNGALQTGHHTMILNVFCNAPVEDSTLCYSLCTQNKV